jgi:hypothetical protein
MYLLAGPFCGSQDFAWLNGWRGQILYHAKNGAKNDKIEKRTKRGLSCSEIFFKKWKILTDSI